MNTDTPKIRLFNKETNLTAEELTFPDYFYFELVSWIPYEEMSIDDINKNPTCSTTGGINKQLDYQEAFKASFKKASKQEAQQTIALPNFSYKIFEEISGITKKMIQEKLKTK